MKSVTESRKAGSLGELIVSSEAFDAAGKIAELGLDEFLDEGFLKDVPVLGTIISLCRTGSGIAGYLFARKLSRFLKKLEEVPETERREFAQKLTRDPTLRRRVQDHLLLSIERLDDIEKTDLVAATFEAYLVERIDLDQFRALLSAIDRCFVADLRHLRAADRPARYPADVAVRLSGCGLLEVRVIPSTPQAEVANEYTTTEFGNLFRSIVLK